MHSQDGNRTGVKIVCISAMQLFAIFHRLFRCAGIEKHFPSHAPLMGGQDKGKWFVVSIKEE